MIEGPWAVVYTENWLCDDYDNNYYSNDLSTLISWEYSINAQLWNLPEVLRPGKWNGLAAAGAFGYVVGTPQARLYKMQ